MSLEKDPQVLEVVERLVKGSDELRQKYLSNRNYLQFIKDMLLAELEDPEKQDKESSLMHYRGRFFYEGPAIVVTELQDTLSFTKVKCQWDNMGHDWVVYPK